MLHTNSISEEKRRQAPLSSWLHFPLTFVVPRDGLAPQRRSILHTLNTAKAKRRGGGSAAADNECVSAAAAAAFPL